MMAAIFYFSAQPFEGPELAWWEVALRKLGHVAGYAALCLLWWWALVGRARRPLLVAAIVSILYAASDEFHQTFTVNRHGSPADVAIDAVGVALACLFVCRRPQGPKTKQLKDAGRAAKRAYSSRT